MSWKVKKVKPTIISTRDFDRKKRLSAWCTSINAAMIMCNGGSLSCSSAWGGSIVTVKMSYN